MAVELLFNPSGSGSIEPVVKTPTFVIAKKNGEKLGVIPAKNIRFEHNLNSANTVDFKVYKSVNGVDYDHWDDIKDLRLMWCKEWDMWFEMHIDITQSDELVKCVNCVSIGEAELSVIKLYGIEINTDNDIARDDYVQTVLYDELKPERSLLHRISEKIPHYTIKHVDNSIANIQRTFTFDDCSIMDAFTVIAEEISCLFILSCSSNANGLPERGIYVYDLMSYCNVCGYRDDYFTTCPECDSTNVRKGFGGDTGIFISDENVAKEITLTTDLDNVFNCFKLRAGDDVITATIANLNPNGSEYVWYFPEYLTNDMSTSLRQKLAQYNIDYNYYQNTYQFNISQSLINRYNSLIQKYSAYNHDLEGIGTLIGFPSSTEALYGIIDFELYLTNALSPDVEMSNTSAYEQASLLTSNSLSPVAITNLENASHATVSGNVLSVAKTIVSPNYKVDIAESTYDSTLHVWQGVFVVTNYSSESDTSRTQSISVTISDDYERYVRQKITNTLKRGNDTDYSVTELFNKQLIINGSSYSGAFANELKKYSIDLLENFYNMCQSCLDVLIEDGVSNNAVWSQMPSNLYQEFYQDYYQKLQAIEKEISLRESELSLVKSLYNSILDEREYIQSILFIKTYIGESLWKEFCSHRRESTYSNDNYISDGLSNSELIKTSEEFLKKARIELVKSATLQHSISSSLNNLLLMDNGFSSIVNSFEVGNWLRIKIDNKVYKLRLINYSIDYDDIENLNVEFSDVIECGDSISDIKSILQKANYMSTTYQTVERQVDKNDKTTKRVNTWFEDGLDATLTKIINNADSQSMVFDEHGLLMRRYDNISSSYQPEQLKIINSTLAVTDDNWATTKTAVGKFLYFDPVTYELKSAFGINAEMVIGRMILGQGLGIYNAQNSLKFDENGLKITNNVNTFTLNPNAEKLFAVTRGTQDLLSVDTNGDLHAYGNLVAKTLSAGGKTSASSNHDGLFIDSYGNLFAGNDNQVQINADGTFDFANGGISYDGEELNITVANLNVIGIDLATESDIEVAISELDSTLKEQIDAKVETWTQSTNPATQWTTSDLRQIHDGDLWLYTGTTDITVGSTAIHPQGVYQYNGNNNTWAAYSSASNNLFDIVDGKTSIYYGAYYSGIKSRYYSGTSTSGVTASKGDIFYNTSIHTTYLYSGSSWSAFTNTQNYKYHVDSATNIVRKWDVQSTWHAFITYGSASTGDFFYDQYSGTYAIYIKQSSGWYPIYTIEDGDYLVDSVDGSTYRWRNSIWNKVTDYESEIQKYMRFESAYGLMIADMTSGTQSISGATSFNTLLTSSALKIRNGTDTLAEYGQSIKLYNPGTTTAAVTISSSGATFNGALNATSLSTGGKTSSSSSSSGLFIDSSGNLYAGSSNQTQIKADGKLNLANGALQYNGSKLIIDGDITAENFTANGSNTIIDGTSIAGTYVTIGDNIILTNRRTSGITSNSGYICLRETGTSYNRATYFRINEITFGNIGTISANGTNTTFSAPKFAMSNSSDSGISLPTPSGSTYLPYAVRLYSGTLYFGTNPDPNASSTGINQNPAPTTYIRGETVRITGNISDAGGVFLGTTSNSNVYLVNTSTAVTSDEQIKYVYDIDDKYINFFNNINPIRYKYKNNGHRMHIGFGARAIKKALEDADLTTEDFAGIVIDNDIDLDGENNQEHYDELYFIRYEEFIALNTMMIKQLQKRINDLERQIGG